MKIHLKNLQKKNPIRSQQIKNHIKKILRHEKLNNVELSVVFVNDQKIKGLNKKFLSRNYPTDVLAFSLADKYSRGYCDNFLGEVIISGETARRNAKIYGTSFDQEIKLYIIHGILHLLGYNDNNKSQIKSMRKKEKELLKILR